MLTIMSGLSRSAKRAILFTLDMLLIQASLFVAFALRFGMPFPDAPIQSSAVLFPAMALNGGVIVLITRLNHIKVHSVENNTVLRLAVSAILLSLAAMATSYMLALPAPRSVPLIFGAFFFCSSVLGHFIGRYVLETYGKHKQNRDPIVIYGAGATGEQLAAALRQSTEIKPICFVDDNRQLHGMMISGLKVHPTKLLRKLIKKHGIKRVLIAMPSVANYRRQEILEALSSLQVEIIEVPNVADEVGNRAMRKGLSAKRFNDVSTKSRLTARDPAVLEACRGKTILIAGAGGQIGRELSQQIVRFEPAEIILFDRSEAALIKVSRSIERLAKRAGMSVKIEARTGSIAEKGRMTHLVRKEGVEIILNAAHYGDPRLAEDNLFDLLGTNVLGPVTLAEVALQEDVEQLILLSSEQLTKPRHIVDKAQKLAETLVLELLQRASGPNDTQINFLRFGNTAGPVGDIVPLLEAQVRSGNAITLPDPEMTRYFVTTARAADTILGALPFGAELHGHPAHLCKGEARKVMEFVNKVVDLSGKGLRSEDNPFGVEVTFCGLRPGEVLHERCIVSEECTPLPENSNLLMVPDEQRLRTGTAQRVETFRKTYESFDEEAMRRMLDQGEPENSKPILQTA